MNPTAAAVAIAAAFTLGPVALLAFQHHQRRERRRKVRGQLQPRRRPSVRHHVVVFRNERSERSRGA
jgi:hypothetical protein